MNTIKVFLVDDHQLILDGIISLIQNDEQIEIIGVAHNGKEAIDNIKQLQPNIILMDVDMPIMNGIMASKLLLEQNPNIKIIILSMHAEKALMENLMQLGIKGYLLKSSSKTELIDTIKKVHEGGNAYSNEIILELSKEHNQNSERIQNVLTHEFLLTKREIEILRQIAEGYSNTEIGDKLFISPRTVDTHRTNMMKKLDVKNIAGLIKYAYKTGLI